MPQVAEAHARDGDDEYAVGDPEDVSAGDDGILDVVGPSGDLAVLTDQSV